MQTTITKSVLDDVSMEIFHVLDDMGVPQNLKGYNYLAYAISLVYPDIEHIPSITKELYPEVAKAFSTTASRAERAIRHAIDRTIEASDLSNFYKYFGNSVSTFTCKPTNSQFIVTISRVVRNMILKNSVTTD